jgi:hypothetical protein
MRHIRKVLSYSIAGTIGLSVIASLNGCSDQGNQPPNSGFGNQIGSEQGQNVFMVIEQIASNPDSYKLVEKHPTSGPTRAILRDQDGSERFLSEDELKQIAEQEAAKVEEGTSRLTQDDPSMHSGGLSLGETLLAAAAGSLIGGMLANRLAGNSNFQRTQQRYGGGRPTSSISQPYNKTAKSQPKSGFFGGSKTGSSSSSSRFGSFGG